MRDIIGHTKAPLRGHLTRPTHTRLGSAVMTAIASASSRRRVHYRFDGDDWYVASQGNYQVLPTVQRRYRPSSTDHIDLFTFHYTPRKGDVVIDIGAGIGTELAQWLELVGPTGRVLMIEADPVAARCLRKLVAWRGHTNVEVIEAAVGATEGVASLEVFAPAGVSNRLTSSATSDADLVEVPLTTLDAILRTAGNPHVALLKMNIEGAETDALAALSPDATIDNYCISCHDFKGPSTATLDHVREWLATNVGEPTRHPSTPEAPWVGFYLYATNRSVAGDSTHGTA